MKNVLSQKGQSSVEFMHIKFDWHHLQDLEIEQAFSSVKMQSEHLVVKSEMSKN